MPVLISRQAPRAPRLDTRTVRRMAERMLQSLDLSGAELSVLLTDDTRIHQLNREHRGKDKPTDVLAYPLLDAPLKPGEAFSGLLGDVVVSLDTAARQATKQGHSLLREVCFLLAHGLLHLLGDDHQNAREARAMHARTRKLVAIAMTSASRSKV